MGSGESRPEATAAMGAAARFPVKYGGCVPCTSAVGVATVQNAYLQFKAHRRNKRPTPVREGES